MTTKNTTTVLPNLVQTARSGNPLDARSVLNAGLEAGRNISTAQSSQALTNTLNQANSGAFGQVAQTLQQFSGIATIAGLGIGGPTGTKVAATASAAMNLIGAGSQLQSLFGQGGVGLNAASALTGTNAAAGILGSAAGVGQAFGANLGNLGAVAGTIGLAAGAANSLIGLFGGGGANGGCPCAPSCRKTEHGNDPEGSQLLQAAGSLVANGANAAAPSPAYSMLENNIGCVAAGLGVLPTELGAPLAPPALNPNDLTMLINLVSRVGLMSQRFNDIGNADWRQYHTEISYTFNAIQNALKQADNNLTKTESIARKAIDIATRLLSDFWCVLAGKEKPTFSISDIPIFLPLVIYIATQSKAIIDLQAQVNTLIKVKEGGRFPPKLENVLKVAAQLAPLIGLIGMSCERADKLYDDFIDPADEEWRDMTPVPNLEDIVIGAKNPDLPTPFPDEGTYMNADKIATDEINSKLGDIRPAPTRLFNFDFDPDNAEIRNLLDQIRFTQDKANRGEGDC